MVILFNPLPLWRHVAQLLSLFYIRSFKLYLLLYFVSTLEILAAAAVGNDLMLHHYNLIYLLN